jgi:hypothetical protein
MHKMQAKHELKAAADIVTLLVTVVSTPANSHTWLSNALKLVIRAETAAALCPHLSPKVTATTMPFHPSATATTPMTV